MEMRAGKAERGERNEPTRIYCIVSFWQRCVKKNRGCSLAVQRRRKESTRPLYISQFIVPLLRWHVKAIPSAVCLCIGYNMRPYRVHLALQSNKFTPLFWQAKPEMNMACRKVGLAWAWRRWWWFHCTTIAEIDVAWWKKSGPRDWVMKIRPTFLQTLSQKVEAPWYGEGFLGCCVPQKRRSNIIIDNFAVPINEFTSSLWRRI